MWNRQLDQRPAFEREQLVPRLRRAFLAGTVALIAVALTFVGLSAANRAGRRWVQESREASRIAREARGLATDRETGLRGFLLSGNPISLAPEFAARPRLRLKLDSLTLRTAGRVTQSDHARAIRDGVRRWEQGYAEPTLERGPLPLTAPDPGDD